MKLLQKVNAWKSKANKAALDDVNQKLLMTKMKIPRSGK